MKYTALLACGFFTAKLILFTTGCSRNETETLPEKAEVKSLQLEFKTTEEQKNLIHFDSYTEHLEKGEFLRANQIVREITPIFLESRSEMVKIDFYDICMDCTDGSCDSCHGKGLCLSCEGRKTCSSCEGNHTTRSECRACICATCAGTGLCRTCEGHGKFRCDRCGGNGRGAQIKSRCISCNGTGIYVFRSTGRRSVCNQCAGRGGRITGYERCSSCDGSGARACTTCRGNGRCVRCSGAKRNSNCVRCSGVGEIATNCTTCIRQPGLCIKCKGTGECEVCSGTAKCKKINENFDKTTSINFNAAYLPISKGIWSSEGAISTTYYNSSFTYKNHIIELRPSDRAVLAVLGMTPETFLRSLEKIK